MSGDLRRLLRIRHHIIKETLQDLWIKLMDPAASLLSTCMILRHYTMAVRPCLLPFSIDSFCLRLIDLLRGLIQGAEIFNDESITKNPLVTTAPSHSSQLLCQLEPECRRYAELACRKDAALPHFCRQALHWSLKKCFLDLQGGTDNGLKNI